MSRFMALVGSVFGGGGGDDGRWWLWGRAAGVAVWVGQVGESRADTRLCALHKGRGFASSGGGDVAAPAVTSPAARRGARLWDARSARAQIRLCCGLVSGRRNILRLGRGRIAWAGLHKCPAARF